MARYLELTEAANSSEIKQLLDKYFEIDGVYSIDAKGGVDVAGNIRAKRKFPKGIIPVRFGKVNGDFYVDKRDLTSLFNSPKIVGDEYNCSGNLKLTSLEGCPERVGSFYANNCSLVSLQHGPKRVEGPYSAAYNKLTSLNGAPRLVGGWFSCVGNPLTTLDGEPEHVSIEFIVSWGKDLPLLRAVKYRKVHIADTMDAPSHKSINDIFDKYCGNNHSDNHRRNILGCRKELSDVGFSENASY